MIARWRRLIRDGVVSIEKRPSAAGYPQAAPRRFSCSLAYRPATGTAAAQHGCRSDSAHLRAHAARFRVRPSCAKPGELKYSAHCASVTAYFISEALFSSAAAYPRAAGGRLVLKEVSDREASEVGDDHHFGELARLTLILFNRNREAALQHAENRIELALANGQ